MRIEGHLVVVVANENVVPIVRKLRRNARLHACDRVGWYNDVSIRVYRTLGGVMRLGVLTRDYK